MENKSLNTNSSTPTFILAGAAAALGLYYLFKKARRPHLAAAVHPDPSFHPKESAPKWDKVDEAAWESFPASDPPAIPTRRTRA